MIAFVWTILNEQLGHGGPFWTCDRPLKKRFVLVFRDKDLLKNNVMFEGQCV